MRILEQPTNMPESDIDALLDVEPEYSVKLGGGRFSVTPEAHEYYGFTPIVDVIKGGLAQISAGNPRTPFINVVLASPHELPKVIDDDKWLTQRYARREGVCHFWMAYPETPQEAEDASFELALEKVRSEPRLSGMSEAEFRAREPALRQANRPRMRANYLAEMVKPLEVNAGLQVAYMREASYGATQQRLGTINREGVILRYASKSGEVELEMLTTQAVINYARRRAEKLGSEVFGIYFEHDFAIHRNGPVKKL